MIDALVSKTMMLKRFTVTIIETERERDLSTLNRMMSTNFWVWRAGTFSAATCAWEQTNVRTNERANVPSRHSRATRSKSVEGKWNFAEDGAITRLRDYSVITRP